MSESNIYCKKAQRKVVWLKAMEEVPLMMMIYLVEVVEVDLNEIKYPFKKASKA